MEGVPFLGLAFAEVGDFRTVVEILPRPRTRGKQPPPLRVPHFNVAPFATLMWGF